MKILCDKHPRYQGKHKPRVNCLACHLVHVVVKLMAFSAVVKEHSDEQFTAGMPGRKAEKTAKDTEEKSRSPSRPEVFETSRRAPGRGVR